MATLEYDFAVVGRAIVEREIAALEKRFIASAARLNREMNKLANGGGTGGSGRSVGGTGGGARYKDLVHGPGRKEQLAQIRSNERAAVQAARAERAQVDQLNRSRQALHNQRMREERQQQRAIDNQTRSQVSFSRQRSKEETNLSNIRSREERNRQRAIDRQSSVQAALSRQRKREENDAYHDARRRSEFVRSTVGGGVGRVAGAVGAVGRAGMAVAGLSAAGLAASSISQAIGLDETTRRLVIAGRDPGETGGNDYRSLSKQFTRTGIATGIAPEQIAEGVRDYVAKTGDLKSAVSMQRVMAVTAQGEDANIKDIYGLGATLKSGLGLDEKQMKDAFAIFTMQGKKGRFELKNFATEGNEILTTATNAGMRGIEGARSIGALAQIGMLGNGTPSETSTSLRNMFFDVAARADKIQKGSLGGKKIRVYNDWDEKKGMRSDFDNFLVEAISASRGSMGEMGEVFKRRGIKTPLTLMDTYQRTYQATKGTDAEKDAAATKATKARIDYFKDLPADFKTIEQDANDAMKSFSVQLEILNTKLKDAVASQLFPELMKLLPQLSQLVPAVGQFTKFMVQLATALANNPFVGLGAAVAAAISYEISKAAIGDAIGKSLTALLVGGGGGPGIGSGATGKNSFTGILGALGTGAGLGISAATVILTAGIVNFEKSESNMTAGGKALTELRDLQEKSKTTLLSTDEQTRARELQIQLGTLQGEANKQTLPESIMSAGLSAAQYAGPLGWISKAAGVDPDKASQWALNGNAPTEQKTLGKMSDESVDILRAIAKNTAEMKLTINTGDKPSPIKPP